MSQKELRKYLRFKKSVIFQHMLLTLSVIGLMVSGYILNEVKMDQIAEQSFLITSGIDWEQIHLISGVFLGITIFWHLFYILFSIYGHNDFMQMFFKRTEIKTIFRLGFYSRIKEKNRFGLQEKVTYWVIGTFIILMSATGFLRLAHRFSINYVPKWLYIWMVEFHSYYGLLLGLILIGWHLYSIFLKPGRFPGTLSWWDGKVSEKEMIRRGNYEEEYEINNLTDMENES